MPTTLILQQDVLYVHTLFIEQKEQHWHSQERGNHHAYSPLLVQKQPAAGTDANFVSIRL
jgi:hypothetical protein